MLIRVMYRNGKYDMVKDFFLEALIADHRIARFYRANDWVEVGRDPVRRRGKSLTGCYSGPERREAVLHRPLDTLIRIGNRHYQPRFSGHYAPIDAELKKKKPPVIGWLI